MSWFGLLKSNYSPDSINSSNLSFNKTAPSVITLVKISSVIAAVKNSGMVHLESAAIPAKLFSKAYFISD